MQVYIFLNHEETFYGVFKTDTKLMELPRRGGSQVAELFTSTGITHRDSRDFCLYRVTLDRSYYWIRAIDYASALVDAILYRRSQGLPDATRWRVLEYDLKDEDYGSEVEIYPIDMDISVLCEPLFKVLTRENRDLVAHAIENVELLDTEDELWQREVYRNTPADSYLDGSAKLAPYRGVDSLSDREIESQSNAVFGSLCLIDQAVFSPDAISLMRRGMHLEDRAERLFWQMIFERWGGCDCRYPHYLYKGLLEGAFDSFLPDFMARRDAFTAGI